MPGLTDQQNTDQQNTDQQNSDQGGGVVVTRPALTLTGPLHVAVTNGTLKRGDTLPALLLTLMDANGAIDLSGATITTAKFALVNGETGDALVTEELEVLNAALCQFRYQWQTGDTNVSGKHRGEVQVTFSDGNIASFPDDGYFTVEILRNLVA